MGPWIWLAKVVKTRDKNNPFTTPAEKKSIDNVLGKIYCFRQKKEPCVQGSKSARE